LVNRTLSAEGFNVVEKPRPRGAGGFENFKNLGKSQREATIGPCQRRVLHQNHSPLHSLARRRSALAARAHPLSGHATRSDDQFESSAIRASPEVAAILFDRVGGRVGPSEERDDSLPAHFKNAHFSTRKFPITSASMPELKNVRIASVGVCTMASPAG